MVIVRGPDRKQLNGSFKACLRNKRKPKKEPESEHSRSTATVCFIVNQERSNNRLKLYLRINSLACMDDEKTVQFTATDIVGRKVKGHYVPPASAKDRLLLSPNKYEGIGKLEYVDD